LTASVNSFETLFSFDILVLLKMSFESLFIYTKTFSTFLLLQEISAECLLHSAEICQNPPIQKLPIYGSICETAEQVPSQVLLQPPSQAPSQVPPHPPLQVPVQPPQPPRQLSSQVPRQLVHPEWQSPAQVLSHNSPHSP
jgi:hypothetical protein